MTCSMRCELPSASPKAFGANPLTAIPHATPMPHPADVAATLVLSDGNIPYTAEHYHLTEEAVLNLVASDPTAHETIARQFRTKALIAQYEVMGSLTDMLASKLPDMRGDHLIAAFKAVSASFATLSASGQQCAGAQINNTTIYERAVPKNVRDALAVLHDISPDDPELLAITEHIDHVQTSFVHVQAEEGSSVEVEKASPNPPVQADLRARALLDR